MIIVNNNGEWAKISQITVRKMTRRSPQGQRTCDVHGVGVVHVSDINSDVRNMQNVDFADEYLSTIIARQKDGILDISGVSFFVPHGSNWEEQIDRFVRDPGRYESIHPRMMAPHLSYLFFARNVFTRSGVSSVQKP